MATQTGSIDLRAVKQTYAQTTAKAQPIYKRTNSATAPTAPTSKITATTDQTTTGNWTLMHMSRIYASNTAYKYLWTCNQLISPDGTFLGCTEVVPDEGTTVIDGANITTGTVTADKLAANSITVGKMDAETQAMMPWTSDVESVPYLLRQSAGGTIDHDFTGEYDKIVGGTVAWNQLYPTHTTYSVYSGSTSGLTVTVSGGRIKITGTATADAQINVQPTVSTIPANHVCLILCDGWSNFTWGRSGFAFKTRNYYLNKHTADWSCMARLRIDNGTTYNINSRFSAYDLTQMFGTTIADYIYNLETTTAGAGVAFFKKLFPNDYYAYDAGTLRSVEGLSEHRTTGKNLLDVASRTPTTNSGNKTTRTIYGETCTIVKDGDALVATVTGSWSKARFLLNTSKLIDGQTYTFSATFSNPSASTVGVGYYTLSNSWAGVKTTQATSATQSSTFTYDAASMAYLELGYMVNNSSSNNGAVVTITNIQLELGSTATTYEPYHANSYPLDSSLTLRGIPKLNGNNLYYDGDTYESDGTVTRKYGIVDLGTLNWLLNAANEFTVNIPNPKGAAYAGVANAVCEKYLLDTYNHVHGHITDKTIAVLSTNSYIYVYDTAYSDTASFKSAMSGVYLVYELATPTTETATSYASPQAVIPQGTEEYVTTGIVPVGHETTYASGSTVNAGIVASAQINSAIQDTQSYTDDVTSTLSDSLTESISQTSTELSGKIDEVRTLANSKADSSALNSLSLQMQEYIGEGGYIYAQNGTLIIATGQNIGNFKIGLTGQQIVFYENDVAVAYIEGKKMYITRSEVTDEQKISNFAFKKRDGGRFTLMYVGG